MHPSTVEFVSHQSETATRPPETDKLPRQSKYIEFEIPRTFCQIFVLSFFFFFLSLNAAACPDETADDELSIKRQNFDVASIPFPLSFSIVGWSATEGFPSQRDESLDKPIRICYYEFTLRSAIIKVERYLGLNTFARA